MIIACVVLADSNKKTSHIVLKDVAVIVREKHRFRREQSGGKKSKKEQKQQEKKPPPRIKHSEGFVFAGNDSCLQITMWAKPDADAAEAPECRLPQIDRKSVV